MEDISEIIQTIPLVEDPKNALDLCSNIFTKKFGVHALAIHSCEEDAPKVYTLHACPISFGKQSLLQYGKTPAPDVIKTLKPIYIGDVTRQGEYELGHFQDGTINSLFCYPMIMGKKIVGVLYLCWKSDLSLSSLSLSSGGDRIFDTLLNLTTVIVHITNLTIKDDETGLYNRTYFTKYISSEILRSSRSGHSLSLLIIPLMNSDIVQETADLLKRKLRQTDYIGRIDQTLLVCLLPETDSLGAKIAAERLKSYFGKDQLRDNRIHWVTYPNDVMSAEEMLQTLIELQREMSSDYTT
ncbi:MAG: hypothetical protein HZA12_05765 [Nitrospirae bacterium]|nr:hypothetical protein [Nitrospirota bacterium]